MPFAAFQPMIVRTAFCVLLSAAVVPFSASGARAEGGALPQPFVQSLAIAAAEDEAIAAFYARRNYEPVWTGEADARQRGALLSALSRAADHGLPVQRYDAQALIAAFRAARTEGDRGRLEVRMTRAFLDFAGDIHSGALNPAKVDSGIVREVPRLPPERHLAVLERGGNVQSYLERLVPTAPAYAMLLKARLQLQAQIVAGGWGAPVEASTLRPGDSGPAVVQLRDRLIAMGYLRRSATQDYDAAIQKAVQQFQSAHGIEANGVAGESTLAALNVAPEERMKSILVALERERWLNIDRGSRHIWVNLTDFTAKIIDEGRVTFSTRSVIGKDVPDQRSPEFSDQMELIVINPSWSVPRSITVKEYLPLLKKNPNAAGHLQLVDKRGRTVSRGAVNFGAYSASNFPYAMRQPPSDGNALGLVKFLFPNPYNIYLHDTPSKSLFENEVRAYSHGCIRLGDPFDFAYALLARQEDDPQAFFKSMLQTGAETPVKLQQPVPVHLVYFTAFPNAKGRMNYRRDIYGRDARIHDALIEAGVAPAPHQG